jgi:predicted RNA-binding protein with TRAM domain
MLKVWSMLIIHRILTVNRGESCPISPRKRSPRNAKNKRGRGDCPVELDKTYEVTISEMSPRGEGIARFHGFTIFIPNAKLGEHTTVRITNLDSVSADAEKT